jgi:hypothetical protein
MKWSSVRLACVIAMIMFLTQVTAGGRPSVWRLAIQEVLAGAEGPASGSKKTQAQPASFAYADVAAILAKYNCIMCHGGSEPRDGLSLESYATIMKGSKSGPVVAPGDPGKSELLRRLTGLSQPRMPATGPPWLTDGEVDVIAQWIAAGAPQGTN